MKHLKALQKILKLSNRYHTLAKAKIIARKALELEEPTERCYSEEEVRKLIIDNIEDGVLTANQLADKIIQSLSPTKEGKEEVKPSVFPRSGEMRADVTIPNNTTDTKQNLLGQVGIIGASQLMFNRPPIEPNQTEAEKVIEKYFPNPDDLVNGRVKGVIVKAMEEYASLARKQVIDEIEEWVKEKSTKGIARKYPVYMELLTKLQTLKK